ncbi:auxin efflux carrier [Phlebopus sp. FC_14]|nr:auxin efflux carrier [Phlebopus sp. FC_14]
MSSIPAGTLIWVAVQPLIRLFLCVGCGFAITKAGLLSAVAARGAGQLILNVTLPNLMFSKIVPAFNSQNIAELGPLILVGVIYEVIGISISWIVKQLFWVPHRFRYGILVAGGWGNVGDIPTSVVMSITASVPFNGTEDQNLAISYIAAFILVFSITLFPLGGAKLIAMDYDGPDIEDEDVKEQLRIKQRKITTAFGHFVARLGTPVFGRRARAEDVAFDAEKRVSNAEVHDHGALFTAGFGSDPISQSSTVVQPDPPSTKEPVAEDSISALLHHRIARQAYSVFRSFLSPVSLSIISSFIIAVVPPLKALFVSGVPGVHISPAPDGQPPLAILMNTATFIGAASVPLGLMTLGSALARLELPSSGWRSLPLGAISGLAVGRLIAMPVLGVLICQGLTYQGLIAADNNVMRFVCIFISCLPTATTQVFLTQVYSGTGNATHLSAFLIPQYALMFGTMTALTAYTLHLLFG